MGRPITPMVHEELWGESPPKESQGLRWLQVWLTCVVFYYPAFWLSLFLVHVLPALIQVALFHGRLKFLRLTLLTAFALSGPAANLTSGQFGQVSDPRVLLEVVCIATTVAILLALVGRTHRLEAGLGLALLAQVGMAGYLWPLFYRAARLPQSLVASAFFFGLTILGLRWMLVAHPSARYLARMGSLLVNFILPLALSGIAGMVSHHAWFPREGFRMLIPAISACFLASGIPSPPPKVEPRGSGWRAVAAGLVATLISLAAVYWGGQVTTRAFERARHEANQAAMASFPKPSSDLPFPRLFFQKGVNFTAEFPDVYASEGARQMLEMLPRYGVNAIALVPYGWSSAHPPRVLLPRPGQGWESDEGVEQLSRVAHALGMKVMFKPAVWQAHLLEISSPSERAAWFDQYQRFLQHYAQLAKASHADIFCVGGELVHLTPYDSEWRKVISQVRQLYPGPLVYAANFGEEFEHVTFWDALDYIGLQEYYSLPDSLSVESIVQKVQEVQQKYHRPVIFTEVGFPSLEGANHEPWDDSNGSRISLPVQAACYQAILQAFYHQPWFEGMYWWKIETNGSGGPQDSSHTPWGKPALEVMKHWYTEGGR